MHRVEISNGELACSGNNRFGQCDAPAGLDDVVAVATGNWHSVALRSGGEVVCWGRNQEGQCETPADLGAITVVFATPYGTLAAGAGGQLHGWGDLTEIGELPDEVTRGVSEEGWLDFAARNYGLVDHRLFPERVLASEEFMAIRTMHRLAEE